MAPRGWPGDALAGEEFGGGTGRERAEEVAFVEGTALEAAEGSADIGGKAIKGGGGDKAAGDCKVGEG